MRACAQVVAETDGLGGTRLAVLRGEAPLLLRRTAATPGTAVVHLVGGAAGPLGGDDLHLDVRVGPGAALELRSVAASMALPHRSGAASTMRVRATVAADATLRWLPEPLIAAAGCHHRAFVEVDVAIGGRLLWRDDVVCGRHGEQPGDLLTDSTVRYAGDTLHRHRLVLGPAAPGWSDAAVLGGGRAYGSVVIVDPSWSTTGPPPARTLGPAAVLMPLAGPGMLATAVGADARQVHAALGPLSSS
jgi:urease accessory protein